MQILSTHKTAIKFLTMKKFVTLLALSILFAACGGEGQTDLTPEVPAETPQELFFNNLLALCGEEFVGGSTYPEDDDHALVGTELRVHIETCTSDVINVNLFRDSDTWHATWILEKRENGLHLYHDHIGDKDYPEGEEPLTGYGGYADGRGSATRQYFPADDHTAEILPEASTNVWMMDMDLENGIFVYYLERHDEPRFRAEVTLLD